MNKTIKDKKEEIIKACTKLYDKENFKDITIKQIAEKTTLSRPSIYNYFETKEEIFLLMFQREYEKWTDELNDILNNYDKLTKEEFASILAHTLENKTRLLRLLSMNMYDMEENSRMENLVEFKKAYKNAVHTVKLCVKKFFKEKTENELINFLYTFFPLMYGIYPYAFLTNKQKEAVKKSGIDFKYFSIYEIAYNGILKLLN